MTGEVYEWPGTEHPSLADIAGFVRAHMAVHGRLRPIVWDTYEGPSLSSPLYALEDPLTPVATRRRTLEVRIFQGPAPYVGDPFIYAWDVARGEGGVWVAGDTRIVRIAPDPTSPY